MNSVCVWFVWMQFVLSFSVSLLSCLARVLFTFAWVAFVAFDRFRLEVYVSLKLKLMGKLSFIPFIPRSSKYTFIYIRQRISKYDQTASCPSNGIQFDWNFHENGFCWLVHILACDVNLIRNCSRNRIISMELRFNGIQKRDFPIYASTSKYKILICDFHQTRIFDVENSQHIAV